MKILSRCSLRMSVEMVHSTPMKRDLATSLGSATKPVAPAAASNAPTRLGIRSSELKRPRKRQNGMAGSMQVPHVVSL